jgi:hypothetical protein
LLLQTSLWKGLRVCFAHVRPAPTERGPTNIVELEGCHERGADDFSTAVVSLQGAQAGRKAIN